MHDQGQIIKYIARELINNTEVKMAGIKNRGTQVHKVKTKYKREKKVEVPAIGDQGEKFLEKIINHIPDYFDKAGIQLMEYGFGGNEVKNLLIETYEKSGTKGLIKMLKDHNFFMVFVDDDLPSNCSLVSRKNWCVWFWNEFDIEEFTFFVIEFPEEFKIYIHKTSSSIRLYDKAKAIEIGSYNKDQYRAKLFNKTVESYMLEVFINELDIKLDCDGGIEGFINAIDTGEFHKDFNTGGFFNFDGVNFPKKYKTVAYQKILGCIENYQNEHEWLCGTFTKDISQLK